MHIYPTHLIYQALGNPHVETEPCSGICAFCGTEIREGVKLENTVTDPVRRLWALYGAFTTITGNSCCGIRKRMR